MIIKTQAEWDGMRKANHAVAVTLKKLIEFAEVGMNTKSIDLEAARLLKNFGAESAPYKDYRFPGWTCISVNHEVCHGIPSNKKVLQNGDLINIDVSAALNGFYGDNGCSFVVGDDIHGHQKLVDASKSILHETMKAAQTNSRISIVGGTMEKGAIKRGYTTIRNICGHGIGYKLHENPREVPCYRDRWNRDRLKKNTVIALETFISTKAKNVSEADDGWTLVTEDKSFVAQHEHTIVIQDEYPVILTLENGISDDFPEFLENNNT